MALAESALNYGIHLIISNGNWLSIKQQTVSKLGTKIELRLANTTESDMKDRAAAATVPVGQPGRALQLGGQHLLLAAPVAGEGRSLAGPSTAEGEDVATASELESVSATAAQIAERWQAKGVPPAPVMQVLPTEISFAALGPVPSGTLALGLGERDMAAVGVDLTEGPHFYAVGASGCGRSAVLKTLFASIKETFTPEEAFVVMLDVGMGLAAAHDPDYCRVYVNDLPTSAKVIDALAMKLAERQPPKGLSDAERARWRFRGERVFVLVDDLNLLAPAGNQTQSVLLPLAPLMERGRQVGLHVFATSILGQSWFGTSGGKVIQAMHTGGTGVLVMDGQNEKILEGVKAAARGPGRGELVYRKGGKQLIQVAAPPQGFSTGFEEEHGGRSW